MDRGSKLDAALKLFVAEADALRHSLTRIHKLGCASPTDAQLEVAGRFPLSTALMQTMWRRHYEHLPPKERRTFSELLEQWATIIEADARRRLGEAKERAA